MSPEGPPSHQITNIDPSVLDGVPREKSTFDRVLGSIERVRKPGEEPKESLYALDEFECDLCKGLLQRRELIQCHYCGRWVCRETCWSEEHLSCVSCASVIKLGKDSKVLDSMTSREGPEAEEQGSGGVLDRLRDKVSRSGGDE